MIRISLFAFLSIFSSTVSGQFLLRPEIPISQPIYEPAFGNQKLPRVAAGERGTLVVWLDSRGNGDVYGTRLDSSGKARDTLGIRLLPQGFGIADLVAVKDDFFGAVFSNSCDFIGVIRIGADGVASEPRRVGSSSSLCATNVSIASNGETMLVAWQPGEAVLIDTESAVLRRISFPARAEWVATASNDEGFLVAAVLLNGRDRDIAVLSVSRTGQTGSWVKLQSTRDVSGLALASDGANYLVVTTGGSLRTQSIAADGTPLADPKSLVMTTQSLVPAVVFAGGEYLVAFAQYLTFDTAWISIAHVALDGTTTRLSQPLAAVIQNFRTPNLDLASTTALGPILVWGHDWEVFSATVRNDSRLEETLLSVSARYENDPRVVRTAHGFVVLWADFSIEAGLSLRARTMDRTLRPQGEVLRVGESRSGMVHRIAANNTGVVITWGGGGGPLYARRFTPDLRPLDLDPVTVATSVRDHAISANDNQALIVWTSVGPAYEFFDDLHGALLDIANAGLPSARLTLAQLKFDDHAPSVAWNGTNFLVVWAHATSYPPSQGLWPDPPDDLLALRISASGALMDSEPRKIGQSHTAVRASAVASSTADSYAVWATAERILGTAVPADGSVPDMEQLSPATMNAQNPFIATYGNRYLAGWSGYSGTYHRSLQLRFVSADLIGPIVGLPSAEVWYGGGEVSVAVDANEASIIAVYDRLAYEPEYGGVSRVFLRAVSLLERRRGTARP